METNRNDMDRSSVQPGLSWERLAESPGFKIVHLLFIATATTTGLYGAVHYNDGFAVVPSVTGVLISAATVWYMIQSWRAHKYTGKALKISVALYAVAMLDEWGCMMAKGIGGALAETYFGWFISTTVVVMLSLWVRLELFSEDYADMRDAKEMQMREVRAKRRLLNHERLSRTAMKEEQLLKDDLARRGRRIAIMALYEAIVKKLYSRSTRRKIKVGASAQVNELLFTTGIIENDSGKRTAQIEWTLTPTPSGDGAASFG